MSLHRQVIKHNNMHRHRTNARTQYTDTVPTQTVHTRTHRHRTNSRPRTHTHTEHAQCIHTVHTVHMHTVYTQTGPLKFTVNSLLSLTCSPSLLIYCMCNPLIYYSIFEVIAQVTSFLATLDLPCQLQYGYSRFVLCIMMIMNPIRQYGDLLASIIMS